MSASARWRVYRCSPLRWQHPGIQKEELVGVFEDFDEALRAAAGEESATIIREEREDGEP